MEVSNDVLLRDIHNTELEVKAYKDLAHGFFVLSQLPENEGWQSSEYAHEYNKYSTLEKECRVFLDKLYRIRQDRGIPDPVSELS